MRTLILVLFFFCLAVALAILFFPCGMVGGEATCGVLPWCESETADHETVEGEDEAVDVWSCVNSFDHVRP